MMITTSKVVKPRAKKTEVVVVNPPTSRKIRRRAKAKSPSSISNSRLSILSDWKNTLNDPFDCPPLPLGFGTFANTTLATGYYHGTLTVNADGSASIIATPNLFQGIATNNSGFSGVTWSPISYQNQSAIVNAGDYYRVVSYGARAAPLVASTSVPGQMYAGTLSATLSTLETSPLGNAGNLSSSASSRVGLAQYGAVALGRPIDDSAGDFFFNTAAAQTSLIWESIYFVFVGLPAGTVIMFECVVNLEVLPGIHQLVAGNTSTGDVTVAELFPTFGSAFRAIRPSLLGSVLMDFNAENQVLSKMSRVARNGRYRLSGVTIGAGQGARANAAFNQYERKQEQQNVRDTEYVTDFSEDPSDQTPHPLTEADHSDRLSSLLSSLASYGFPVAGITAGVLSTAAGRRALYQAIDRGVEHLPL